MAIGSFAGSKARAYAAMQQKTGARYLFGGWVVEKAGGLAPSLEGPAAKTARFWSSISGIDESWGEGGSRTVTEFLELNSNRSKLYDAGFAIALQIRLFSHFVKQHSRCGNDPPSFQAHAATRPESDVTNRHKRPGNAGACRAAAAVKQSRHRRVWLRGRIMKPAYSLFIIAFASLASGATPQAVPTKWIKLDAKDAFSLLAPPGTRFKALQGTDSFVATFKNPKFTLEFDYGEYSNPLTEFTNDRRYTVEAITIDGLNGRLVTGLGSGNQSWGCKGFLTALYVINSYADLGASALEMSGCTNDKSQIPVIQTIFKTIKFTRPNAGTANAATEVDEELFAAASNGDLVKVQALIASGAHVNAKTAKGATALIIAAHNGHAAIVRSLIDGKADVNAKTCLLGASAAFAAQLEGGSTAAASTTAKPCIGQTALMAAVQQRHADAVRALLAAKADVNIKTMGDRSHTALLWAAESGRADLVRMLLAAGADVTATWNHGVTALMEAAHDNFFDMLQALIIAGADVNARTEDGDTALIMASQHEFPKVVQALIAEHADVNAQTTYGDTAVIMAARMGNAEVVRLLIAAGADVNARTRKGETALMLAIREGRTAIVPLLRQAGAKE